METKTQHTPGPHILVDPGRFESMADCGCTLRRDLDENRLQGDPALFQCPLHAAAPDLKARLSDLACSVAELLIDNAIDFDDETAEDALRGMLKNAQEAVAKAEGREGGE